MTVLTLAIIGASIWIAGGHTTETYRTYLTYVNESVAGLSPKAPVKFNGVDVGNVEDIEINPYNPQQVRLELKISDDTPITEATRATLQTQGITGLVYVSLKAEKIISPPLKKIPSEPYPVIRSSPSMRIDQVVQGLAESFKGMFDTQNKEAFKKILHNLEMVTESLSMNSKTIDETLKSARIMTANGAAASEKFPHLAKELDDALAEAHAAADELHKVAVQAHGVMQSGNRSIKDLSDETLPAAQQVMLRLKDTLNNIEQLTDQMTKNPAILIRGKPPATPGPGEK